MRFLPLAWLAVLAVLNGCSAPVVLYLSAEAAALAPNLQAALPGVERDSGLSYRLVVGSWPDDLPGGDALVVSTGADLPAVLQVESAQPVQAPDGTAVLPALTGAGLPLFFDVTGITVFAADLPAGTADQLQSWATLRKGWPKVLQLSIAAGEPELRVAAWLGAVGDPSKDFEAGLLTFGPWWNALPWFTDAWNRQRADVTLGYAGGRSSAFVETYRDSFRANPPGFRHFFPLTTAATDRPTLVGSVLRLRAVGGVGAAKAADAPVTPEPELVE